MYGLYKGDFSAINSYVATAWFPAAPQGEASILFGYHGYSKTISAGSISAAFAIEHSIHLLNKKKLRFVCCGGVETPNNPVVLNAMKQELPAHIKISDASAFYCMANNEHACSNYKFTISSLIISRDLNACLNLFKEHNETIGACVLSGDFDYQLIPTTNRTIYVTDELLGHTYGAAFSLDLYVAYQSCKIHQGFSFIMRKDKEGQYAACLVQIKHTN